MSISLSPLGRFVSPVHNYPTPYPLSWYPLTDAWQPRGAYSSTYWSSLSERSIVETGTVSSAIILQDTAGNTFDVLTMGSSGVEYFANFTTYTSGGNSCACVDFPDFTGTFQAVTGVEFEGQGTETGITAINLTIEEISFKVYNNSSKTEITTHAPACLENSILTARNGQITGSGSTFAVNWDYNYINTPTLLISPAQSIITGIYGYRARESSTSAYKYYGLARYNGQSTPTSSIPETYQLELITIPAL